MAISTTGGSGTTSGSVSSGAGTTVNVFTTPNTTDAIFIVNLTVSQNVPTIGNTGYFRHIVGPNTTVYHAVSGSGGGSPSYVIGYDWCGIVIS